LEEANWMIGLNQGLPVIYMICTSLAKKHIYKREKMESDIPRKWIPK
jgi:hypothetical protein